MGRSRWRHAAARLKSPQGQEQPQGARFLHRSGNQLPIPINACGPGAGLPVARNLCETAATASHRVRGFDQLSGLAGTQRIAVRRTKLVKSARKGGRCPLNVSSSPSEDLGMAREAAAGRFPPLTSVRELDRRLTSPDVSHSGNFSACSIAWNRGSLRSESRRGSCLRSDSPGSRSRIAFSSHSSAFGISPHCA